MTPLTPEQCAALEKLRDDDLVTISAQIPGPVWMLEIHDIGGSFAEIDQRDLAARVLAAGDLQQRLDEALVALEAQVFARFDSGRLCFGLDGGEPFTEQECEDAHDWCDRANATLANPANDARLKEIKGNG